MTFSKKECKEWLDGQRLTIERQSAAILSERNFSVERLVLWTASSCLRPVVLDSCRGQIFSHCRPVRSLSDPRTLSDPELNYTCKNS